MINIYLCEDEISQLSYFTKIIQNYIKKEHLEAKIVTARTTPEEILKDMKNNGDNPALFFIDIQLDRCSLDGFELARQLKENVKECYLVFLTSQEGLAYRAFEYELDILEYIVKRPQDFLTDKMSSRMEGRINTIFNKIQKMQKEKKSMLVLECGSRLVELETKDILFVQAVKEEHRIEVYSAHQVFQVKQSLKSMGEILGNDFIYVNKSCIVQKAKIKEIDKKNRFMLIEENYKVEISYRKMKSILMEFPYLPNSN